MGGKIRSFFSGRNIYLIISLSIVATLMILGSLFLGPKLVDIARDPEGFREFLGTNRFTGYLIFIGIQFVQIIFAFIPGEFIEIGAGYAFGSVKGTILCLIGCFVATALIFALTKAFGRRFTEITIDSRDLKKLKFLQDEKKLTVLFILLYFIPGTPKDLITYFAGITKIRFIPFLIISTFCRIPSIITSTLAGSALGERQYIQSIIIFGITGLLGIGGYLVYAKISKSSKQSTETQKTEE